MKWAGETNFKKIGKGTSLLFFENGYVSGQPAKSFSDGDTVEIRMGGPSQPWVKGTLSGVTENEAFLTLNDGSNWRMTPLEGGDFPTGITWAGGPSEEWVVRSQI